ncbi:MAG: flagellar export chaperone FliS, partial [Phycisphaerales bacterium]|nr:flagellar export chaperone FliS [Phycisphaerales bacterium]
MTQDTANVNTYLRTKVLTSTPEELRLLLLDGAMKFARQGRAAMEAKDIQGTFSGFSQCRNIVMELINSVRPEIDPDLAKRVTSLYTFIYSRILTASMEKNFGAADEAIKLLEYERETWVMLMDKLAIERAAAMAVRTSVGGRPAAAVAVPAASDRVPLSIE